MRYIAPNIGDNKAVYKGVRYWIIEFTGKDKIGDFSRDNCEFIMYDKYEQRTLATIVIKNNRYYAKLAWGIDDFTKNFGTIKEVVTGVVDMNDYYARHCFGKNYNS